MAAQVLNIDDFPPPSPRRMTVPLQTTVASYMQEKMGWPPEFCTHYADRFWNHYQAQGWKLSNGNAMKDWRAAFNSQWQRIKDDGDRALLAQIQTKVATERRKMDPVKYLNLCLDAHSRGEYKPKAEEVLNIYDYLKRERKITLTTEEVERILREKGNRREQCRMMAVRILFDRMIREGKTFEP